MPSSGEPARDEGELRRRTRRNVIASAGLLVVATGVYAFFPWSRFEPGRTVLVVTTFVAGLVGTAALVVRQVRAYRQSIATGGAQLRGLLLAVYIAMLFFASTYYLMAAGHPDEIVGLRTRTDALYFTLTILSTVGFGDIHAASQGARAIVSLQIGFDLLVIGLAVAAAKSAGVPRR